MTNYTCAWRTVSRAIRPPFRSSLAAHAAKLLSVFEPIRVNRRELTARLVGLRCVGNAATFGLMPL